MSENFGFKEKIIHALAELPYFDKISQKRAEWFIEKTGIEKYLKKDGQYLDVGTGKGHIVQQILADMERKNTPLKAYYGIDVANKPLEKVQNREQERQGSVTKNSMNFVWSTGDKLPFANQSLDGVSLIFSIHHMNKEKIEATIIEAMRVLKPDGHIFIAEDLVESEEQRKITEAADRKLNLEGKNAEHNYKSDFQWKEYLEKMGLEIINKKFFHSQSKKGTVQHGFYVVKLT